MDIHLDPDGSGNEDGEGQGVEIPMTSEERKALADEIKQATIQAAQSAGEGVPEAVKRMINELIAPKMDWRDILRTQLESSIKIATDQVSPLREKNIENLSRIQRLKLELQSLYEENTRTQDEIESIKKSLQILDEDIGRERGIIIDANSNEKRLKEEKTDLIEIDSKYFETEKLSNDELENAKNKLKDEQKAVDEVVNNLSLIHI